MILARRDLFRIVAGLAASALPFKAEASSGRCSSNILTFESRSVADAESLIGQEAPPFEQEDVNPNSSTYDHHVGPQEYEGKVVLINFWDPETCLPCREEMPDLQRLYSTHDDVVVIAVDNGYSAVDLSPGNAYSTYRAFMDDSGIDLGQIAFPLAGPRGEAAFTFCVDEENYDGSLEHFTFRRGEEEQYMAMRMAGLVYGVRGTPTLFLVDKEGIVREHHEGSMNFKELEDLVRPYL